MDNFDFDRKYGCSPFSKRGLAIAIRLALPGGPRVVIEESKTPFTIYVWAHRQHRRRLKPKIGYGWSWHDAVFPAGIAHIFKFCGHEKLKRMAKNG